MDKSKQLQGQARAILQHEEVLKFILKEEAENLAHADINGESAFEVASQYKFNKGIIEGFERLMRRLHKLAQ